ncbi:conserved hypothetical protein [Methanococcus maripaludis C5]|uniref:Uncharacterized protein n=1 Tax=Methanococcus maripaludis (strain C5 / ATCC BAA-1333) TaxID=402880 RepID=A4FYW3_METM5|nr:hypothetical protein [Methanococcus maripaludis]ABO35397.1 conserved hypothetical protein [Methanococcus maripaludis C5]
MSSKFEELFEKFERPGYMDFEKAVVELSKNEKICGGNRTKSSKYFIVDKYSGEKYPLKCFWIAAFGIANHMDLEEIYKKIGKSISGAVLITEFEFFGITLEKSKEDIRFKIIIE